LKTLFTVLWFALSSTVAAHADDTARQLVEKSWQLYRQASTEKESVDLHIIQQGGKTEEKSLTRWIKYDKDGEDKVTVRFTKPAADDGLGLLTWRHPGKTDDQWLKLPSMDKVRRVSSADQEKYFAGTDFTYEDLRQLAGERTTDFDYKVIRSEGDSKVIEATPKAGKESIYGKRISWISSKYATVKTEYYAKNGKLIKTQTNGALIFKPNGLWRPGTVEMDNAMLKRKTVMKVRERGIDATIASDTFTQRFLESKGH